MWLQVEKHTHSTFYWLIFKDTQQTCICASDNIWGQDPSSSLLIFFWINRIIFQKQQKYFAACSEHWEQKRIALSTLPLKLHLLNIDKFCVWPNQYGKCRFKQNHFFAAGLKSLHLFCMDVLKFSAFICGILSRGASQGTGDPGKWLLRTRGVIQEIFVHTQKCVWCLGQHAALATGGPESCDFNSLHYLEHRKPIIGSLCTVKFSVLEKGRQTLLYFEGELIRRETQRRRTHCFAL